MERALYVGATGLTTSLIPDPTGNSFRVDVDPCAHQLEIVTVFGGRGSIPLKSGPVSDLYTEVMHHLAQRGVAMTIWPMPGEIDLRTSGDTVGGRSRVVGYGAFGIYST